MSYINNLMKYIDECPSAYHVVAKQRELLDKAGFTALKETEKWKLIKGGKYYVTRNDSAIIAFVVPKTLKKLRFRVIASHSDCPAFKIKNDPEIKVEDSYVKLNVESYGGAIYHTWLDRPLSVAGRVFLKGEDEARPVKIDKDICMIPSLAIHMNRDINKGYEWNVQRDLLPLLSLEPETKLMDLIAKEGGFDPASVTGHDLYLYNRENCKLWGPDDEFLSGQGLDDRACAFSSLMALLEVKKGASIAVHAVFDNEEVGSSTRQGACSTFLKDVTDRIGDCLGYTSEDRIAAVSDSFLLSADNAHAMHPNYPDKCDPTNRPILGKGIVLKFAGNQKYTTDGKTAAMVRKYAEKAGVTLQNFHNRSDMAGGSTLGNLSANQVAFPSADIGIGQLAMHSVYETIGTKDVDALVLLARSVMED